MRILFLIIYCSLCFDSLSQEIRKEIYLRDSITDIDDCFILYNNLSFKDLKRLAVDFSNSLSYKWEVEENSGFQKVLRFKVVYDENKMVLDSSNYYSQYMVYSCLISNVKEAFVYNASNILLTEEKVLTPKEFEYLNQRILEDVEYRKQSFIDQFQGNDYFYYGSELNFIYDRVKSNRYFFYDYFYVSKIQNKNVPKWELFLFEKDSIIPSKILNNISDKPFEDLALYLLDNPEFCFNIITYVNSVIEEGMAVRRAEYVLNGITEACEKKNNICFDKERIKILVKLEKEISSKELLTNPLEEYLLFDRSVVSIETRYPCDK